jgi:hypothetical protein
VDFGVGIVVEIAEAQFAVLLDDGSQGAIIDPHLGIVVDIEIEHGTYDCADSAPMTHHANGIVFIVALHDRSECLHGTGLHLGV